MLLRAELVRAWVAGVMVVCDVVADVSGICVGVVRFIEGLEVVVASPAGFAVVLAWEVEAETWLEVRMFSPVWKKLN